MPSGNDGSIPLAVVIQPTFSGRYTRLFIISDLYRVLVEIAEVHTDFEQSILKYNQLTQHANIE